MTETGSLFSCCTELGDTGICFPLDLMIFMSNVYLLYGENDYLINKKIEEIKYKYNNYDIVSYDMTIDNISSSVEDLSMNSLFSTISFLRASSLF